MLKAVIFRTVGCNCRMSYEEQQGIAKQMSDTIKQLWGLEHNYFGVVNREPVGDTWKPTYTCGPFDSEKETREFLLRNIDSSTLSLYLTVMQQKMSRDHKHVISDLGCSLHNIIVKYRVIVDGWYPEHWKYVKFCAASFHRPEGHNFGPSIFPDTIPISLSMINSRLCSLSKEASVEILGGLFPVIKSQTVFGLNLTQYEIITNCPAHRR